MKHHVIHGLDQTKAKEVTEKALTSYQKKLAEFKPEVVWESDYRARIAFTVKGMGFRGEVEVAPKDIVMDLDVPMLLRPFKGKALAVIETEIQKWLTRAKTGRI